MDAKATEYLDKMRAILTFIQTKQEESISAAAQKLADVIERGGVICMFGAGHSHCAAEDVVFRAGGLAAVDLIYDPALAGEFGMFKASFMERLPLVTETIMRCSNVSERDGLVVVSNCGLNNAPIEAALYGRKLGIPVIAITSVSYSSSHPTRHSRGKKLMEVADIVIDTGVPFPDATIKMDGLEQPMGGLSTAVSIVVGHLLCISAASLLLKRGVRPDVFLSGNLDSAEEHNMRLWKKYRGRVRVF
jgi:uncharacterized phosphosugar-binding protein